MPSPMERLNANIHVSDVRPPAEHVDTSTKVFHRLFPVVGAGTTDPAVDPGPGHGCIGPS